MARGRGRKLVVDTSALEGDTRRLARGLTQGGLVVSGQQAQRTAGRIRENVPIDTGRLYASVAAVATTGRNGLACYGVTYGHFATLGRYPYVVNAHQRIVRRGTRGARTEFYRALQALAATEVGRV